MNLCFILGNKRYISIGKFEIIGYRTSIFKRVFSVAILSLLSSSALCQTAFNPKNAHYLWPTSASHALSSTFGETRAGHFHAALDIKTWGRRGYPVYATRAGTLFRVAMGPRGYGNVLYLKHPDGSYSIYAHLMRFNQRIQHWADSLRFSDYSASFDRIVDSLHIHIKQGEKIALSGASGIGPPHLHFELRTPENHPFNPLRTNLTVKDTRPPVFAGLAIEPLSLKSTIKGKNRIFTKSVSRHRKSARFGNIDVAGPVGLSVRVSDHADGVHNPYAAYKLQLKVDGRQVFQAKVDSFSYQRTSQMDIDRVYPLLQSTGRAYQRLYLADGNTLPFYQTNGNGGRLDLSPGRHHIIITASDYFGNTRKAKLTLHVLRPYIKSFIYKNPIQKKGLAPIQPAQWGWFHNWVDIPFQQFRQLTIAPIYNPFPKSIFFKRKHTISAKLNDLRRGYFSSDSARYFILRRVDPGHATNILSPDKRAYATFPKNSFYDAASVAIKAHTFGPDSSQITIFPDNHPIKKPFKLYYKQRAFQMRDTTLSFYHYYSNGYLRKLKTEKTLGGIQTAPSSLGTFLILADHTAPQLYHPHIGRRPDGQWLVYLPVRDNRSGIDYQKTRIYVNGVRGLTLYQPEDHRLVYYRPDFKPQTQNTVRIIAYDREGNETIRHWVIDR